jgi:RNA polymerase sigma-70 factor (ECF subfamily)
VQQQGDRCNTVPEDEALMGQLKGGTSEALAVLFHRYQRLVFTVAKRILRDAAEAEDVTQDVFIEIYRKAGLYDPRKGSVKTWVLQYAYHRSFNRRKYLLLRHAHSAFPAEMAQDQSVNGTCEQAIRHCVRVEAVHRGMNVLNDTERSVIKWVSFEGLSLREASVRMQLSYVNARNHYYRGLKKLKRIALERGRRTAVHPNVGQV